MIQTEVAAAGVLGAALLGLIIGFVLGQQRAGGDLDQPQDANPLRQPAEALGTRPTTPEVTRAINDLLDALETVIQAENLEQRGIVSPDTAPRERARAVVQASQEGRFGRDSATGDSVEEQQQSEPSTETSKLTGAATTARQHTTPETRTGQRLLTYLESPDEANEQQISETLQSTIESLNDYDILKNSLEAVQPHTDALETSRTLQSQLGSLETAEAKHLRELASKLETTASNLDECEQRRKQFEERTRQICSVITDQSTVSIQTDAEPLQQLQTLDEAVNSGTITFQDEQSSVERIVAQSKQELSPESVLAEDFIETLSQGESINRPQFEQTLQSVVDAIDQAETMRHRLEGIQKEDVRRLADRLQEELEATNTRVGTLLADRTKELSETIREAGDSDSVTVYAARQELRFYDLQLLPKLRESLETEEKTNVDGLIESVEQRRAQMRKNYPAEYPNHDHSIPIHFFELVKGLHQEAEDARINKNNELATGYLRAADMTLDWIEELYERQAYNVLLEQLRG